MACTGHAIADDITAITPVQYKPNVLLLLDYSKSMNGTINGERKIDALRSAVHGVIDQFGSEINIGIGSLFAQEASGITWPVSDLSKPANSVDPNITDLSLLGSDVVKTIIDQAPFLAPLQPSVLWALIKVPIRNTVWT